jgi:phosphate transport system substrate-binding protein
MRNISIGFALLTVLACGVSQRDSGSTRAVRIDGSSTVFPLTQALVREFGEVHPEVGVRVSVSGTGGGFQKFCGARTDISTAARPIRRDEIEACHRASVLFIELPIAYDGIAVVVNPKAAWVDHLTVDELMTLWSPEAQGKITRWNQVRAGWPDRPIHLYGAGPDSGTYDYFTAAITDSEGMSRNDFVASEDDDVIAKGVADDELGLGFLPLVYYNKNRDDLRLVPIDNGRAADGAGPIAPNLETVGTGTYQPLARPIFIYVRQQAMNNSPAVRQFVDFYLARAGDLAQQLGYSELGDEGYELVESRCRARWTGTAFGEGGSQVGLTIDQLLASVRVP